MRTRQGLLMLAGLFLLAVPAGAFQQAATDSNQPDSASSRTLTMAEAKEILTGFQGEILSIEQAEMPGFWQLGMKVQNQVIPLYLDDSKKYLFSGNVIRIKDRKNLTEQSFRQLNPVDLTKIPTDDALQLGNPEASNSIIVFTDPHCPYCAKLHEVMKEAVAKRSDLLFLIKLLPFKQSSRTIAESLACSKSLGQLEAAFARQDIPETSCESKAIEQNLALAKELGVSSTPTLILPRGQIAPGYKPLPVLLELIDKSIAKQESEK